MNQAIRRTWLAAAGVFVLLLGSLTYVQFFRADALDENPWNSRQLYDKYGSARGSILVDGTEIAYSEASNDGFNYQRQYAQSEQYAALTGYFSMVYGATGLEQAMNSELSGDSDAQFYDRIAQIFSGGESHGASVELTLDGPRVSLTCGSARFSLQTMPVSDYPTLPEMPPPPPNGWSFTIWLTGIPISTLPY